MNQFELINRLFVALIGALLLSTSHLSQAANLTEANQLFRQGNYAQALAKTDAYLADTPQDAQGRFLKGLILTEQNKVQDAVIIFSSLIDDFPELPEPHNNLAVLYASQGEFDKARVSLEMAIRTHPSYSTAHENLGDIYAKMASQAYDRALQLDRGNSATQTKLAMIQDLFDSNAQQALALPEPVKAAVIPVKVAIAPVIAVPVVSVKAEPPKPQPAPVALPTKVASVDDGPTEQLTDVLDTVNAWAVSWSAQNVDEYLSHYAADFKPKGSTSLAMWEATRKKRVSAPKFIKVRINKPTVIFTDNTHATVKFHQSYRANHFKANNNKTLTLVKTDNTWLIQKERSK
ncbi:MAG: tetratricopeptide repeat protein [Gallionella sp.]